MRATVALVAPLLFVLLLAHQAQAYGACLADSPDSKSDSGEQKKDECTAPCIIDCSGCAEYDDEEPLTTEATSTMSSSSSSSAAPTETSSGSSSAGTTESSSSSSSSSSTSSSSSSSSTAVSTSSVASEPCPCLLVKKLNKIKYNLTASDQIIFEGCMKKIRPVLVDSSKSANKKISLIAHHLRKCFRDNESIKRKMKHEKIGRWGGCYKFLFAGITIDKDNIDSQTTVDSAGKCNLTDAIESQTAGDKCGPGSSYLIGLFAGKVKKILRRLTPGFDKGRKLGWFKKVLFKHLLLNSAVNRSCVLSVKVPEFDSLDHFADSCEQSETSSSAIDYLSGNGDACNLIYSLKQGLNSSANSTNTTILQEGYQFVQELNDYFAQTSDLVLRIKYVSLRFSLKSRACRLLLKSFKILGIFLSLDFSDVVSTSHDCTNNGCGNMTYGSPSVTYPECCMVDSASNSSVVEDGCAEHEKNLTSMEKMQWNSYKNSIVNCIRKLYDGDFVAKLECVKTYVRNYCNNVATMKSRFLAVELPPVLIESATEVKHGNFGTLCGCAA